MKPITEMKCSGSYYELGYEQGKLFRHEIIHILESILTSEFVPPLLRRAGPRFFKTLITLKGLTLRSSLISSMKKYVPRQWERMRGVAEGSGLGVNALLVLSNIETTSAQFHYVMGCIAMGLGSSRVDSHHPLIAYNHDFPALFKDHLLIRKSQPTEGYASIQLGNSLLTGAICGMNEKGLVATLNHAYTREPLSYFESGIFPTLVVQEVLDQCDTLEEAIELARHIRFGGGSLMTLMDAQQKMGVLEFSRGEFGVRRAKGDFILTLNDYCEPNLKAIEVPHGAAFDSKKFPNSFHGHFVHEHNEKRRARCEALDLKNKKWTIAEIKNFLADHDNTAEGNIGTICRHHGTSETIASVILNPQERSIEVSRGHACEPDYRKFSL